MPNYFYHIFFFLFFFNRVSSLSSAIAYTVYIYHDGVFVTLYLMGFQPATDNALFSPSLRWAEKPTSADEWYPRYRFFHARRWLTSVSGRELSAIKRLAFLKNEQRERSLSLSMIALSLSQLFTESSLLFSFFVIVLQIYILMIVIFLQEEIISFLLIPTNLSKFFETFLTEKN